MKNKFTIDEILESVNEIYPENKSLKKFDNKEILESINQIELLSSKKKVENSNILNINNIQIEEIKKKEVVKKIIKEAKTFDKPLLLNKIIKYQPVNNKYLFLNKLHNSKLQIITMKTPRINK